MWPTPDPPASLRCKSAGSQSVLIREPAIAIKLQHKTTMRFILAMSIWALLLYVAQWAVQVLPENQVAWGYMQALFKRLEDTGQLQEQTIEQLYSEAAGKFLADRFVTGTCPKCGYEVRAISLHCGSL